MANQLYNKGKEALLSGQMPWTSGNFEIVLIDTANYTFNPNHQSIDDIPGIATVASAVLTGKTATNGVADAADIALPSVTGPTVEALVIWSPDNDALLAYIDTASSLPFTPDGNSVTLIWDVNGIFRL